MAYQEKRTLTQNQSAGTSDDTLAEQLRQRWYRHQRQREQSLRIDIEHLYQHQCIQRQEAELEWHNEHDLFSEDSRRAWSVSKRYLATAGFGAGAVGGAGLDALTLGHSLGAGALVGGLIGAAGSYFYGDRLMLPALHIGVLQDGLQTATFGPVQDSQFGYVVLGRAVDHWWHISQRNHAGRDVLVVTGAQDHWLAQMERSHRNGLQKSLQALASRRFDPSKRQRLIEQLELAQQAFAQWQLRPFQESGEAPSD